MLIHTLKQIKAYKYISSISTILPRSTHLKPYYTPYHTTPYRYRTSHSNDKLDHTYTTSVSGKTGTPSYRVYFYPNAESAKSVSGESISPWHDIPYKHQYKGHTVYTYINEIPKSTVEKYEIATKEVNNPIKQDIKKEQLRVFKYGKLPFNYGAIPQTWEDPHAIDQYTKLGGDNDPIDVVEISDEKLDIGVYHIKVLGILCLIDENETDWKVIAVHTKSPLYNKLHSVDDIEKHSSGTIDKIKDWFINYKTADGKPQNTLGLNSEVKDSKFGVEIIEQCHQHWFDLINKINHSGGLSLPHKHAKGPV